jgi:hypothetical protein
VSVTLALLTDARLTSTSTSTTTIARIMRVLWWLLCVLVAASLAYEIVALRQWRRRGAEVPPYAAGSLWSSMGLALLVASNAFGAGGAWAVTSLVASAVCVALGLGLAIKARRRRP